MRLCEKHWDELRQAISDRGLDKFVANGETIMARMQSDNEKDRFEPMINANMALFMNATNAAGMSHMADSDEQENKEFGICPLCLVIERCACGSNTCPFKNWINVAADEQQQEAVRLGLVASG